MSRSRQAELERLAALPFAHRGLHGGGVVENSRGAFEAAVAAGHGIELDVRISLDGEAIVFHDDQLDRLTGVVGAVAQRTAAQLQSIALFGAGETIMTLRRALDLIASRVPLLIELKAPNRKVARLCLAVFRSLEGYRGPVGVMSFNPEVGRWYSRHAPLVLRGLVITESGKKGVRGRFERAFGYWRAKPDFLAYDIRDLPSRFAANRRKQGVPVFTWTVRSEEERARAALHADQPIFERAR